MNLNGTQLKAEAALRHAPGNTIRSSDGTGIRISTIRVLERRGIAEVTYVVTGRRTRRDGTTHARTHRGWIAQLMPTFPSHAHLKALDQITSSDDKKLTTIQRDHAAAYCAHTMPKVSLKGSPAAAADYSVCGAYQACQEWDTAKLLETFALLRHMTGATPLPPVDTPPDPGPMTNAWSLTAPSDGPRPGKELGRVRGDTQNEAAVAGNGLLGTFGGYSMRCLGEREIDGWVEDVRLYGLVLRVERSGDAYQVRTVADGAVLTVRPTADEARAAAYADLHALFNAFTTPTQLT